MKIFEIIKQKKKIKITKISNVLTVAGPLGLINYNLKKENNFDSNSFFIEQKSITFFFNKLKYLFRSVSNGWFKELNLNGIGYKCFKINDKIALDIGYSNLLIYKPTTQLKIKNFKNKLVLFALNQDYLNNVAIKLKNFAKPDLYKGKGILFKNQIIKLKKKSKS